MQKTTYIDNVYYNWNNNIIMVIEFGLPEIYFKTNMLKQIRQYLISRGQHVHDQI